MNAEYQEDLHAELGYRTAGRREISQREWFSLRGDPDEPAPTPKAFKKLVNVLRVKKWVKANPQKRALISRRYYQKSDVQARRLQHERDLRRSAHRARALVIVCARCSVEFCLIRPLPQKQLKFCSKYCCHRNIYLNRNKGRRRIAAHPRLTGEQREKLLARYEAGERAVVLAKEFGITRCHVGALARGRKRRSQVDDGGRRA